MPHTPPNIVVLDADPLNTDNDNPWTSLERLGAVTVYPDTPPDRVVERAKSADVLVTNKTPIGAALIESLPALKLIAVLATGYNVVDVAAAKRRGIAVCNVPEYGTNTVAQYTLAMILELCHGVGRHARSVAEGQWQRRNRWSYWLSPQVELHGKTLGIVGFGRIGRRVGELAHAFGMRVLATRPRDPQPPPYEPFDWADLPTLAAESDVVTLHCPQTPANRHMVDDAFIRRMKPGAFLVNVSRGGLVDEAALAAHLDRGTIAGAAVDVVSAEPITADNPLLRARNCLITPHIAWSSLDARQRIMSETVRNVAAFLAGETRNRVG